MVCDICGVRDAMMVVQQVSNSGKKEIVETLFFLLFIKEKLLRIKCK